MALSIHNSCLRDLKVIKTLSLRFGQKISNIQLWVINHIFCQLRYAHTHKYFIWSWCILKECPYPKVPFVDNSNYFWAEFISRWTKIRSRAVLGSTERKISRFSELRGATLGFLDPRSGFTLGLFTLCLNYIFVINCSRNIRNYQRDGLFLNVFFFQMPVVM